MAWSGARAAQRYFLTAERFDAFEALRIGFEQVRATGLITANHLIDIQAELERRVQARTAELTAAMSTLRQAQDERYANALVYTLAGLLLAALALAIIPVLLLYLIFSRQLIRGITSGAVK